MHLLKAIAIYSSTMGEQHFNISLLIPSSPHLFSLFIFFIIDVTSDAFVGYTTIVFSTCFIVSVLVTLGRFEDSIESIDAKYLFKSSRSGNDEWGCCSFFTVTCVLYMVLAVGLFPIYENFLLFDSLMSWVT